MDQEAASSSSASPSQPGVLIILWDATHYPSPPKSVKIEVPLTLTGQQFREKIAEELGYPIDSFEIKVKNQNIETDEERPIEVLGIVSRSIVTISRKNGAKEEDFKIKKIPQDSQIPSTSTPTSTALVPYGPQNNNSYGNTGYSSGYQSSYSNWSYPTKAAGRSSSGFVGLSNQGATCYMNSLIQTLYMTPEFRAAVYNWSFDEKYKKSKEEKEQNGKGSNDSQAASSASSASSSANKDTDRVEKEKMSIPLQLQRLFARLQLSDQQAVKTKDLTKSFGWEDADAFTQHDVQELCRVLFDALEKNFKGTEQANIVNELYQGKMKDYVQCKECNNESARTDDYLDIPLVIRGFGEATAVSSVEEALQKFVTPEILDKDNQYNCEKCGKKVDATKGLKFTSFPYLLALQLKRFDFDYTTMRRIKLNDRVTFPHYLDLNSFIYGDNKPNTNNNTTIPAQMPDPELAEEDGVSDEIEGFSDEELVPNGYENGSKRMKKVNGYKGPANGNIEPDFEGPPPVMPTPERPYIYELYSVLIHRGSTMGGHYYAYIKSFENKKWYEFNDSSVTEINSSEIKKAFGGDDEPSYPGYSSMYKSTFKSTANAYMLMYRKVDPVKNLVKVPEADVPKAAIDIIESEKQQQKDKRESAQREREMAKFKVFYPATSSKEPVGKELALHKATTFEEATKQAAELFGLSEKWAAMGLSGIRLRGYQPHNELPTTTYTGQEHKTLEELNLFGTSMYSPKNMMIDTRENEDEPFADYNMSDVLFRVAKFDPQTSTFAPFVNFYVPRSSTLSALKHMVAQRLGIPVDKQRILKEAYTGMWANANPVEVVDIPDDYPIRGPKVSEPEKYYIEYCEDLTAEETTSPAQAELIRLKNLIEVKFNIPDKEGYEGSMLVDKNTTLKEFREKIQPVLGLGIDDFKIKRGQPPSPAFELVGDLDTLADNNVRDGMTLIIEKGKPLKEGEVTYSIFLLELEKDSDNITELFDLTIDENSLVSDVKKVIAVRLRDELQRRRNEKKPNSNTPTAEHEQNGADEVPVINSNYIRLRDLSYPTNSRKIGKALPVDGTLKKVLATSRRIAVQILPEPETVTEDDLVMFVQLFKPSTYGLTRKEDFVISGEASVDQFRAALAKKFSIPEENLGIAKVDTFFGFYDDPELLEIPNKLGWDKHHGPTTKTLNESYYRNGNLVLVRDNTEPLKELTKEEHDAIEKETRKRAAMQLQYSGVGVFSGWNRKEKALKIHTSE